MIFDLADDFADVLAAMPPEHPRHHLIKLIDEAFRRDLHFIARHASNYPQALFQSLWNNGWWYDCSEAADHYRMPENGWARQPPWERTDGDKLSTLLDRWKKDRESRRPGLIWLRSARPPFFGLGNGLRAVFSGHSNAVNSVSLSPDGRTLASGSEDTTVRLWDISTGKERCTLKGHTDDVTAVAFHPDGNTLAGASRDGSVRIWDALTFEEHATLKAHSDSVWSIAYSPDGKSMATSSDDKTIKLWDVARRQARTTLRGHRDGVCCLAFSPDGKMLISGGADSSIILWETLSGRIIADWTHGSPVLSICFSPDGGIIAAGSGSKWNRPTERCLKLWDANALTEMINIKDHSLGEIRSIEFSPDGSKLAGCYNMGFRVWDVVSARNGVPKSLAKLHRPGFSARSVTFVSDGNTIATGNFDGTIKLWDFAGMCDGERVLQGHDLNVRELLFRLDGVTLTTLAAQSGYDRELMHWDLAGGIALEWLTPDGVSMVYDRAGRRWENAPVEKSSLGYPVETAGLSSTIVPVVDAGETVLESIAASNPIAFYPIPLDEASIDAPGRHVVARGKPAIHVHILVLEGNV